MQRLCTQGILHFVGARLALGLGIDRNHFFIRFVLIVLVVILILNQGLIPPSGRFPPLPQLQRGLVLGFDFEMGEYALYRLRILPRFTISLL